MMTPQAFEDRLIDFAVVVIGVVVCLPSPLRYHSKSPKLMVRS